MTATLPEDAPYNGYLTLLKTLNVQALKAVLNDTYPTADFRGVHVSIEYPVDKVNYPGIWVDYTDSGDLLVAGVDHKEYVQAIAGDSSGGYEPYTRWKYSGYVSYTVAALTSTERDRLYDELVRIFAFGSLNPLLATFRNTIESNPFIAANMNFDKISPQGNAATPGTPWGTDEIIYERTINMEIIGEFISDNTAGTLAALSGFSLTMTSEATPQTGSALPVDEWH